MIDFFVENFKGCVWVAVLLVSMIPTLESKVAIPLGVATEIWGEKTISLFASFVLGYFGTLVSALLLFVVIRLIKAKISGFVCGGFFSRMIDKGVVRASNVVEKNSEIKKLVSLAFFVALPIPLTGAYSGCLLAGFSSIKPIKSIVAIAVGHLVSCIIVLLLCFVFEHSIGSLLLISVSLILIFVFINCFMAIYKRRKKQ